MPRPRGNEWLADEMRSLRQEGVDVLVSLLAPDEAMMLGLSDEAKQCAAAGMRFVSYPIQDHSVPGDAASVRDLAAKLGAELETGRAVAIHCFAGIGRSSLIAACVLAVQGLSAEQAFEVISEARGFAVPDTDEQRRWVEEFAAEVN